jgi:hypothetical protein
MQQRVLKVGKERLSKVVVIKLPLSRCAKRWRRASRSLWAGCIKG